MQSIPNAAVTSLINFSGELKLNTEVNEILFKENKAYGVRVKDGTEYYGKVISNASPQFTYEWLSDDVIVKKKMKKAISKKRIFDPIAAMFISFDESKYSLGDLEGISILSKKDYCFNIKDYTPETAPIIIYIYPKREEDAYRPLICLVPISYEYHNNWETEDGYKRGELYRKLKKEAEKTIIKRIEKHMGSDFVNAISHHELSTPLTYERYTYSKNGSFMGWSVTQAEYGKFLRQRTLVEDLYLVGQWVFPGFGVAGVMASGYYLAKELLKEDGIDLKKDFKEYFT